MAQDDTLMIVGVGLALVGVYLYFNEQTKKCTADKVVTCPDGTTVKTDLCVNGKYVSTGLKCQPVPPPPPECTSGDFVTQQCANGSRITIKKCVNGKWVATNEKCAETPRVSCAISEPLENDNLSALWSQYCTATVTNTGTQGCSVVVGMTLVSYAYSPVYVEDYPTQTISLYPNETKQLEWNFDINAYSPLLPIGGAKYKIVVSAWDVEPIGNCEALGTCNRLCKSERNFTFSWTP